MTVEIRADFVADAKVRADVCASPGWHIMGLRMLARSVEIAPGGMGKSMFVRFVYGPDGRLEIGSARTVKGNLALLDLIEQGTKRHYIPMGAPGSPAGGPLAFEWAKGGGAVVFAWVNHPGTKKNPFVQKAMQQILHEAAGLTLVPV
jgi:hypothetical protein